MRSVAQRGVRRCSFFEDVADLAIVSMAVNFFLDICDYLFVPGCLMATSALCAHENLVAESAFRRPRVNGVNPRRFIAF